MLGEVNAQQLYAFLLIKKIGVMATQKKKPNFHIEKPVCTRQESGIVKSPLLSPKSPPKSPKFGPGMDLDLSLSLSIPTVVSNHSLLTDTSKDIATEVERHLQEALTKMIEAPTACRTNPKITFLLESLATTIAVSADDMKPFLSAHACVVCGRDDRAGEQRKSGFKCYECIGAPSNNRFRVKVDECTTLHLYCSVDGLEMMNDYVLEGPLGAGSFGKVRRCYHLRQPKQKYACKFMNKKELSAVLQGATSSALENVRSEIEILKSIRHPNVVQIYEVIDDPANELLCVVMELLPGGCILELDETGRAKPGVHLLRGDRLKKDMVSALRGLQYLHQRGIMHRDIKPDNMMYDARGNLLITDFSISHNTKKERAATLSVNNTSPRAPGRGSSFTLSSSTGTTFFMPPEDFVGEDSDRIEIARDMWGLGVSIYAAVFGHIPFHGRNQFEYEIAVTTQEVPFPAECEPQLRDLLSKMLDKNPRARITTDQALKHSYISSVRTMRGYAVESPEVAVTWEAHDNPEVLIRCRRGSEASTGCQIISDFFQGLGTGKIQVTHSDMRQLSLYRGDK